MLCIFDSPTTSRTPGRLVQSDRLFKIFLHSSEQTTTPNFDAIRSRGTTLRANYSKWDTVIQIYNIKFYCLKMSTDMEIENPRRIEHKSEANLIKLKDGRTSAKLYDRRNRGDHRSHEARRNAWFLCSRAELLCRAESATE